MSQEFLKKINNGKNIFRIITGSYFLNQVDWIEATYPLNILEKLNPIESTWLLDNDWTTSALYASKLFGEIPNLNPLTTFQKHLGNLESKYPSMNLKERLQFTNHLNQHFNYARHLYDLYQSKSELSSKPF